MKVRRKKNKLRRKKKIKLGGRGNRKLG